MMPPDLHHLAISMAFWPALGHLALLAAKGLGRLFTTGGGRQALGDIGSALGGAAKGRLENQQILANQQLQQDILRQRIWENQQQAIEGRNRALLEQGRLGAQQVTDANRAALERGQLGAQNVWARNRALLERGQLGAENVRARNQALLAQGQLGLQGLRFGLEAPNLRAAQAVRGDVMANLQDVGVNRARVGGENRLNFTGGLRPSVMGPASRGAGALLAQLGQSQLGKDRFTPPELVPDAELPTLTPDAELPTLQAHGALPTLVPDMGPPPALSRLADPRGGKLGDILGIGSLAAQFLSQVPWGRRQSGPYPHPLGED